MSTKYLEDYIEDYFAARKTNQSLNSEGISDKQHLLNCIEDAKNRIKDLEFEISKCKERIKGWQIGIDTMDQFENYKLEVEFEKLAEYESKYIKEQYEKFLAGYTPCEHLDIKVSNDLSEITCYQCDKEISPKVVPPNAKITWVDEWVREDEYGSNVETDYVEWTYEEFAEQLKNLLNSTECFHEETIKFTIKWNDYNYDVFVCLYCGEIVRYKNLDKEWTKTGKYIRSKDVEGDSNDD